jgi:hypothetical protein
MTDAELEGVIMAAINMKYGLHKAADGAASADGTESADGAGA